MSATRLLSPMKSCHSSSSVDCSVSSGVARPPVLSGRVVMSPSAASTRSSLKRSARSASRAAVKAVLYSAGLMRMVVSVDLAAQPVRSPAASAVTVARQMARGECLRPGWRSVLVGVAVMVASQ